MDRDHTLDHHRHILAALVRSRREQFSPLEPLPIDPYVAMSLLQKAIRRGRLELALGAAATLLETGPERLWRRLCVTAYEDIGIADFDSVALVTAGLTGKLWRAEHGGEWAMASVLIERMCAAVKCRTADDLAYYICEQHPSLDQARPALARLPTAELLDRAASEDPLPKRALALWYAVGTVRCRSSALPRIGGDPQGAFDGLRERGYPEAVVEVCREGLRKGAEVLAPMLVLLAREAEQSAHRVDPDSLPDEAMIGPVPGWAYDMHVREGNRAVARFLETGCETARWARESLPDARRVYRLGCLLFAVESSLVDRRLRWPIGDEIRRMAELECQELEPAEAALGLRLLRQDLPVLDEARRHVAGSNIR